MTDFLRIPSFGRIVAELDGSYPGLSMFDIVTKQTSWNRAAKKHWKDKSFEHLVFESLGTKEFKVTYHAARWLPGQKYLDGFDFCEVSNIRLSQVNDSIRKHPVTIIEVDNARQNFGSSDIRIMVSYGSDFCVPVYGLQSERTWMGSLPYLSKCIRSSTEKELDPLVLTKMEGGGQLFLARMALELGIIWERHELSMEFATPETTSEGFAKIIDKGVQEVFA